MEEIQNRNIEEATQRLKKRLPLEKIRCIPKYRDLSSVDYEKLIKNTETVALLILKAIILKNEEVLIFFPKLGLYKFLTQTLRHA